MKLKSQCYLHRDTLEVCFDLKLHLINDEMLDQRFQWHFLQQQFPKEFLEHRFLKEFPFDSAKSSHEV